MDSLHVIQRSVKWPKQLENQRATSINDASITLIEYPPFGQRWIPQFLQRYPNLQSVYTRIIDVVRIRE